MSTRLRFSLFAVFFFPFLSAAVAQPTATDCTTVVTDDGTELTNYGCALHEGFEPILHNGRDYIIHLVDRLAPHAGENPASYSIDIIKETRGPEYINAMTCARSKVIWVSRKAYQELYGYEPALAYLVAHEIAHGSHRTVSAMMDEPMTAAERTVQNRLTYRQKHEIAVDQRAADVMLSAGYSPETILAAARFILWQDGADLVLRAGPSHPAGWDRVALLSYYLGRQAPATEGRVLPRR